VGTIVTRVSLLIDTNHIYSDTIMTVLRHLPEYEFGKRNPLCQIRATYFVSIIIYLTCTTIIL